MQSKRPRFNPLILALALAGVLMIWSVLGTSDSSTGGSTMSYSTVVHYFENNQVTAFTLDRNTSIITLTLKEGKQELPETTGATAATQASGGLISAFSASSSMGVCTCSVHEAKSNTAGHSNSPVLTVYARVNLGYA